MKLIVGLGNPGKEYENTRHNIGFKSIDAYVRKHKIKLNKKKYNGIYYKHGKDFIIAKPETFMNNSGSFVQAISKFFKIDPSDILIIHDDLDMTIGNLRIRNIGSSGGQNGMRDILLKMGTEKISRLKIGIGKPHSSSKNYVLGHFSPMQLDVINGVIDKIVRAIENFLEEGAEKASNELNKD